MNEINIAALLGSVIDALPQLEHATTTDLEGLGVAPDTAEFLVRLHQLYCGPGQPSRRQRSAVKGAQRHGHGLIAMQEIEREVTKTKTTQQWRMRQHLCATPAGQFTTVARKLRREWNPKDDTPVEKVSIRRYANGTATMSITARDVDLTDVYDAIDQDAPAESFLNLVRGEGGAGRLNYIPMITLQLDTFAKLLAVNDCNHTGTDSAGANPTDNTRTSASASSANEGNANTSGANPGGVGSAGDIIVRANNGARMTGKELAERILLKHGFVAILSRVHGPVDVYRMERFATDKQRLLLAAESPECAWLDCHVPFDKCQVHHITSWADGGETNIKNLTVLCPHHNGANEDHPPGGVPIHRGRMVRVGGQVAWQSPGGGVPVPTSPTN
ncbi:HNH endonuclease signature motif containing protein [Corynebacterium lizhenjunii]|uniref:HNH endonuclease signature motif containing protein n=1 Tax=Corynebacterium lizhenjunii TaxID=2709394 RepID=UPI001F15F6BB|nr:HNH endonuclease signature motif containing protein [Corynebacterium lizhenjunii]